MRPRTDPPSRQPGGLRFDIDRCAQREDAGQLGDLGVVDAYASMRDALAEDRCVVVAVYTDLGVAALK